MGNGIPRLLRWLAVLGMGLAFANFVLAVAEWAAPIHSKNWVGLRFKHVVSPTQTRPVRPAGASGPSGSVSAGRLVNYLRAELATLFLSVRDPGIWFGLSSIVYLLATRHLAASRLAYDSESDQD
ncbi:MAG TPA: hypothetical protein VFG68_11500 [Fimbriiglobus sp.]|nr:hypothetical protein [Fimbriiglobus sp.]